MDSEHETLEDVPQVSSRGPSGLAEAEQMAAFEVPQVGHPLGNESIHPQETKSNDVPWKARQIFLLAP